MAEMTRAAAPDWHSHCIAVVGMNGVGKSHFGRRLAARLGMRRVDTDVELRRRQGDEHAFIEAHGWEAFRKGEEATVLDCLRPGAVVVLSGGAVESPAVRAALKKRAVTLWLHAGFHRVHKHLKAARRERPEFKGGVEEKAAREVLARRTPLYRGCADVVVHEHVPFRRQVTVAVELLSAALGERVK